MTASDSLIASLSAAVVANPADLPLRLHLATLLVDSGRGAEAVPHLATVLQQDPANADAGSLMMRALAPSGPTASAAPTAGPERHGAPHAGPGAGPSAPSPGNNPIRSPADSTKPAGSTNQPVTGGTTPPGTGQSPTFDWHSAEKEFQGSLPPPFIGDGENAPTENPRPPGPPTVRLADVAGMTHVKERLELAFFGPMRHPELAGAYGKSLRGGLLLYGPPGVGKTYLARAVAGEMGADFLHVSLADVLDQWLGAAEKNVRAVFDAARRAAPCVLFFDEVDAIGQRRSRIGAGWSGMRGAVQQLLTEMDSVGSDNDGIFILAATNAPWDVDPALRRPGRFDRTVLVLPPDGPARAEMLRSSLGRRPIAGIDIGVWVKATEGFSGADIVHLADSAAEYALAEALAAGVTIPIGPQHLQRALTEVSGSTGPWFDTARNAVLFGNEAGEYDDLLAYMRTHRLL